MGPNPPLRCFRHCSTALATSTISSYCIFPSVMAFMAPSAAKRARASNTPPCMAFARSSHAVTTSCPSMLVFSVSSNAFSSAATVAAPSCAGLRDALLSGMEVAKADENSIATPPTALAICK